MTRIKNGWIVSTVVLVVLLMLPACSPAPPTRETIDMPVLDGETIQLQDLGGEVVVLNFWATWCGPCAVELPELQAFYDNYQDEPVALYAVNLGESAETARQFFDERGFTIPIILNQDGSISDLYALRGQPTTVIIDQTGEIVYQHTGVLNQEILQEQVDPLLSG